MGLSNFSEHALLDYMFGLTSYTPSGTLYAALTTTTPTEAGGNFTEPSSLSGYARVGITNNKTNWTNAAQVGTSGEITNKTEISFPTASGNWGTIVGFGLYDNPTAGNLLGDATFSTAFSVVTNNTPVFPTGTLSIRLD